MNKILKFRSLLILLIVSSFLGFYRIDAFQLANDEVITLNISSGFGLKYENLDVEPILPKAKVFSQLDFWKRNTLQNVVAEVSKDNGNMLVYQILVHVFIKYFGVSDFWIRGFSAFCYILSGFFIFYLVIKYQKNEAIAFTASFLYYVNPVAIYYAHQMRSYTFATVLLLLITTLVLKFMSKKYSSFYVKLALGLSISVLIFLCFLSHFFVILSIMALAIFWIFSLKSKNRNMILPIVCTTLALILVWYFLFGKVGIESMQSKSTLISATLSESNPFSFGQILSGVVSVFNTLNGYVFQFLGYRNREFFFLGLFPAIILWIGLKSVIRQESFYKLLIFLILCIIIPILLISIGSLIIGNSTFYLPRYVFFVIPFYSVLLAVALYSIYTNKIKFGEILLVIFMLFQLTMYIAEYKFPFEGKMVLFQYEKNRDSLREEVNASIIPNRYRLNADFINKSYKSGQIVSYNSAKEAQFTNLYLGKINRIILQTVNSDQIENIRLLSSITR